MAVPFVGASSVYCDEKSINYVVVVVENAVENGGQPSGSGSKTLAIVVVAVVVAVAVVAAVSSAAAIVGCAVDKVDVQVVMHRGLVGRFDGGLYDVGKRL
jgi:hypothetical protein